MVTLSKAEIFKSPVDAPLVWTESKAGLIELAYALKGAKVINEGRADLKDIIALLERSFHVDLDNYGRTFQEILRRKKGLTNAIDKLKAGLQSHVDIIDGNHEKRQNKRQA